MFEEVRVEYAALFGKTHPALADVMRAQARLYHLMARYEESETHYRDALNRYEQAYGHETVASAGCLQGLTEVMLSTHRLEEAVQTVKHALSILHEQLGANHRRTLSLTSTLGRVQLRAGHLDQALAHLQSVVDAAPEVDGQKGACSLWGDR